ncbi:hypothetical protein LXL04_021810 [Taraxacum kok-saghyz]
MKVLPVMQSRIPPNDIHPHYIFLPDMAGVSSPSPITIQNKVKKFIRVTHSIVTKENQHQEITSFICSVTPLNVDRSLNCFIHKLSSSYENRSLNSIEFGGKIGRRSGIADLEERDIDGEMKCAGLKEVEFFGNRERGKRGKLISFIKGSGSRFASRFYITVYHGVNQDIVSKTIAHRYHPQSDEFRRRWRITRNKALGPQIKLVSDGNVRPRCTRLQPLSPVSKTLDCKGKMDKYSEDYLGYLASFEDLYEEILQARLKLDAKIKEANEKFPNNLEINESCQSRGGSGEKNDPKLLFAEGGSIQKNTQKNLQIASPPSLFSPPSLLKQLQIQPFPFFSFPPAIARNFTTIIVFVIPRRPSVQERRRVLRREPKVAPVSWSVLGEAATAGETCNQPPPADRCQLRLPSSSSCPPIAI